LAAQAAMANTIVAASRIAMNRFISFPPSNLSPLETGSIVAEKSRRKE
jgi:hypothetical protein